MKLISSTFYLLGNNGVKQFQYVSTSHDPPLPPVVAIDSKKGSLRALKAVNFFSADVQNDMKPCMPLFLQSNVGWEPAQIGLDLAAGNIARVLALAVVRARKLGAAV